ncbi:MAG: hypothetical protein JRI38_02665 [Deltaproteobacteria bacterium]|nr:hypothetical protein [Deltaproteobacteria bacterium]
MSSCMGGVRTAGDLVAWMQLTGRMKIDQAKDYVAAKLNLKREDLTDEAIMAKLRYEKGLGSVIPEHDEYTGMAAKCKIAELLDISINSVNLFQKHLNG